ncbi:unnamed protein product [Adineta steineri]|uniref:Uncharacterized protein n=1 Tax=Adineta steineri TaxID=433720 RepID=A0A819WD69_9BILA|nr:unnamed protein product [Adineta steineri]CAF4122438.1 unnamed protein product [Adineta steineri]
MILSLFILCITFIVAHGVHFNGGTITWAPIDPYDNSSSVNITITQSYAWAYPTITCANDVPITTSGRSTQNWNLTCVVDCSTDGGYSTKPIDILTDCSTVFSSLGIMNSERSHNMTLDSGAHFYLANVGSAWVALNSPAESGLEWSIVTFIDLRMRPDGFIDTPPVASVVSPQYAIVNETIQINIPVSDVNVGDDVRCRWATYTAGYRRRKRSDTEGYFYKSIAENKEIMHVRKKRSCASGCTKGDKCTNSECLGTTCGHPKCTDACCDYVITTTGIPTNYTTTVDTPGTLKSTSSYPHQQAIDECGGICYPGSVPNGTTLSNCTITFTGLIPNTWYAVAVQVEDFINDTNTVAMSSVPVQFLIYVLPQPTCSKAPIITSDISCLQVQVGVNMSFNLYVTNLCNTSVATITDLISSGITDIIDNGLTDSPTNSSLSYVTYTWTPQSNDIGLQEMCAVAYTSQMVQSSPFCVTFTVQNSSAICVTTTTTTESTTTSTSTTTATSSTTSTTTSVTTTTATTSKNSINWPLILGLSLLALLLALCCCCCYWYWFLWPGARRRRRQRNYEDIVQRPFGSQNIFTKIRKTRIAEQMLGRNRPSENYLMDTTLHSNDNIPRHSLTGSPISSAAIKYAKSTTDIEKERIAMRTNIPIKIVNRNINGHENIEPPNYLEMNRITPTITRLSVIVVPLNKVSTLNDSDEKKNKSLEINQQSISNALSAESPRTGRVSVTKLPRNSIVGSSRPRASIIDHTNNAHLRKSLVGIQSTGVHSKITPLVPDNEPNIDSGVKVVHVSRKSTVF